MYLSNTFDVPDTVLATEDTKMSKINKTPALLELTL